MNEAINTVCHLGIVIGLTLVAVGIAISQGKEFKEEFNAWKKDKSK